VQLLTQVVVGCTPFSAAAALLTLVLEGAVVVGGGEL